MAKFLKKILFFFALIAIIDIVSGFGFDYLRSHAKGGDTQKNYYVSEKCCDDCLILGSSRAARHYDPLILEDSLGMSCYNCGEPGCGIITAYARYGLIEQRHNPKLVIYEVTPNYDYYKTDEYSKYLGKMRPYADKRVISELFSKTGDELEFLRIRSNLYKNNSFIIDYLKDILIGKVKTCGYEPLFGSLNTDAIRKLPPPLEEYTIDELKLSYVEKFIQKLSGENVKLVFVASPQCLSVMEAEKESLNYNIIIDLCKQYNVPFINNIYMKGVSGNRKLFCDFSHLNREGAELYTKKLISDLKRIIIE